MPRILNASQLAHVTYYDTLLRNVGTTDASNGTTLFSNGANGRRDITNMKTPGVLPGDQILLIKALRVACAYESLNDPEFTAAYGSSNPQPLIASTAGVANAVATGARAELCYFMSLYGSYFTLEVGNKPYVLAPTWFAPAGGGPSGFTTETARSIITNGVPASSSTLRFAKPVQVSRGQAFNLKFDWYNFLRSGTGLGANGTTIANIDPLAFVNNFDGIKVFQAHAEGIETRDVE